MKPPTQFCWTRYGTEAGQTIEQILERKEEERRANNGLFLWGIGNAVAPSMRELVRVNANPEVIFSPIKSRPRMADVAPPAVVAWAGARCLEGKPFRIPESSLVTSRFDPASPRSCHFALVCFSERPLTLNEGRGTVSVQSMKNLLTGRTLGASQTTAIVRHDDSGCLDKGSYAITLRVRLAPPYLLELTDPVFMTTNSPESNYSALVGLRASAWRRNAVEQLGFELT